jgi:hypothetical protein
MKKQIPKKTLYAKFDLKTSQQDAFDADVARIDIVASFSPHTVPAIADGVEIKEFYVLNVQLKRKDYNPKNIELLTKMIPQNMVFALLYENEVQFAVYHTELVKSDWQNAEEAKLKIQGINVDAVWENIVVCIGNIILEGKNSVAEHLKKEKERQSIQKQISVLMQKLAKEKQFNKQIEINTEIKTLRKQLLNL